MLPALAKIPPRATMTIEVSSEAKARLEKMVSRYAFLNQKGLMSRLVEWFAAQPSHVQREILWSGEEDAPEDITQTPGPE